MRRPRQRTVPGREPATGTVVQNHDMRSPGIYQRYGLELDYRRADRDRK
jgi:hypothetical protein